MIISTYLKTITLWLAILMLAILNGSLREMVLIPTLGSFNAFITSGVILSGCIFLVAYFSAPWYGSLTSRHWLLIGLIWLLLTLVFEFGFGHFVQYKTWPELWQAYTFQGGNIWPLVLVTTLFSPWIAARWRGLI